VPASTADDRVVMRGRGERILLVDDEKPLAMGTGKLLERFGYASTVFARPNDAWAEFARQPLAFDLVITDLTMPEMDGIEFSRRILALRPDCPVLLTTGSFNEATQQAAEAVGIRQVLLKPIEHHVLMQGIATHLGSNMEGPDAGRGEQRA
jgi:CheY-like chemotaxis protein